MLTFSTLSASLLVVHFLQKLNCPHTLSNILKVSCSTQNCKFSYSKISPLQFQDLGCILCIKYNPCWNWELKETVTCPIHPCGPIKGTNYQSQANQSWQTNILDVHYWRWFRGWLLLLVVIGILIWRCKYPKDKKSSSLPHVRYSFTDPENSNMVYSKLGAIRAKKGLAFGQETVEIQDPVSYMRSGFGKWSANLPTPQLSWISWKPKVLMSVSITGDWGTVKQLTRLKFNLLCIFMISYLLTQFMIWKFILFYHLNNWVML